jgi:hypothetical protein
MDTNAIPLTESPIPQIVVTCDEELVVSPVSEAGSVTNSDKSYFTDYRNIREQFDQYYINTNDEATDDEVPHFPVHVLNEMHPSPAAALNAAYLSDSHDDSDEDCHTVDSEGLALEVVGKDGKVH